ncbi:hypothetical protein Hanom_Chr03g00202881 [Helianthus anomalus]
MKILCFLSYIVVMIECYSIKKVTPLITLPHKSGCDKHHGDPGQFSSQGGGFLNFQSLHDLLQENLMCTRNTYNMASNTYTRVGVIERNISNM